MSKSYMLQISQLHFLREWVLMAGHTGLFTDKNW